MTADALTAFLGSVEDAKIRYLRGVRKVEDLRLRCEHVTSAWESEPRGGGDVHKDGPLVALAQARGELPQLYREWENAEEEVNQFLEGVPSRTHRAILQMRYVELLQWPRIMKELQACGIYYEERSVFRHHGIALNEARELWRQREEGRK